MENQNITLEIKKPAAKRGRPPKSAAKIIQEVEQAPQPIPNVPPVVKKRGRPRKNPLPEAPIVKKPRGRPKVFKPQLNIEIPESKYIKNGYTKTGVSQMDEINMNEKMEDILTRAKKTGFQIRDMRNEDPAFIKNIPRGTFIKYITTLNQFRIGGILRQVDDQLRYFSLYNPKIRNSWSVQIPNVKILMFKSKKDVDEEEAE
jgi:hypothetical protein